MIQLNTNTHMWESLNSSNQQSSEYENPAPHFMQNSPFYPVARVGEQLFCGKRKEGRKQREKKRRKVLEEIHSTKCLGSTYISSSKFKHNTQSQSKPYQKCSTFSQPRPPEHSPAQIQSESTSGHEGSIWQYIHFSRDSVCTYLKVFKVDLVSISHLLCGRHFGIETVDAVLGLIYASLE